VTYAQLEESFKPDLPEGAPAACAGMMLRISVRVGEDGLVKEAKLLEKADPACERAALDAVRRFKFKPALDVDGLPVEAPTAVSVEFPEAP
jgi:TonB family protein